MKGEKVGLAQLPLAHLTRPGISFFSRNVGLSYKLTGCVLALGEIFSTEI